MRRRVCCTKSIRLHRKLQEGLGNEIIVPPQYKVHSPIDLCGEYQNNIFKETQYKKQGRAGGQKDGRTTKLQKVTNPGGMAAGERLQERGREGEEEEKEKRKEREVEGRSREEERHRMTRLPRWWEEDTQQERSRGRAEPSIHRSDE